MRRSLARFEMRVIFLLPFLLFSSLTLADDASNIAKIDAYIEQMIKDGPPADTTYPKEMKAKALDLEDLLKTDYPEGIAFGAMVSKTLPVKYSEIKKINASPGGIYKVVTAVKTQKDFEKLKEDASSVLLKLVIEVPVVPDIHTKDLVKAYETPKGYGVLEWRQEGAEGDLAYNRGLFISIPDGDKTKVFVIGIHVLKPERKILWVGRGAATNFARRHYSGYISALESLLPKN